MCPAFLPLASEGLEGGGVGEVLQNLSVELEVLVLPCAAPELAQSLKLRNKLLSRLGKNSKRIQVKSPFPHLSWRPNFVDQSLKPSSA